MIFCALFGWVCSSSYESAQFGEGSQAGVRFFAHYSAGLILASVKSASGRSRDKNLQFYKTRIKSNNDVIEYDQEGGDTLLFRCGLDFGKYYLNRFMCFDSCC